MVNGFIPAKPQIIGDRTHWYERWWVWTAAGVVVAGSITAAVLLSGSSDNITRVPPLPKN
jgi:hypothetical protein